MKTINNYLLKESWVWKPNMMYVHKAVNLHPDTSRKIGILRENDISFNNDVAIYSFIHPDVEFCVSMTSGLHTSPGDYKAFFSYTDPERAFVNKTLQQSGFGIESITKDFVSPYFLSSGRETKFKLVDKIECEAISTTLPLFSIISFVWENFRTRLQTPNKLNAHSLQFSKGKLFLPIPQVLMKSNYMFEYTMRLR